MNPPKRRRRISTKSPFSTKRFRATKEQRNPSNCFRSLRMECRKEVEDSHFGSIAAAASSATALRRSAVLSHFARTNTHNLGVNRARNAVVHLQIQLRQLVLCANQESNPACKVRISCNLNQNKLHSTPIQIQSKSKLNPNRNRKSQI